MSIANAVTLLICGCIPGAMAGWHARGAAIRVERARRAARRRA